MPVAVLLDGDDVLDETGAFLRRLDDTRGRWLAFEAAFSWMVFTEWWCLRRWIVPDGQDAGEVFRLDRTGLAAGAAVQSDA